MHVHGEQDQDPQLDPNYCSSLKGEINKNIYIYDIALDYRLTFWTINRMFYCSQKWFLIKECSPPRVTPG